MAAWRPFSFKVGMPKKLLTVQGRQTMPGRFGAVNRGYEGGVAEPRRSSRGSRRVGSKEIDRVRGGAYKPASPVRSGIAGRVRLLLFDIVVKREGMRGRRRRRRRLSCAHTCGSTAVRRSGRGRKRPIRQRGGAGFCASRVCDGILVEGPLAAAFRRGGSPAGRARPSGRVNLRV